MFILQFNYWGRIQVVEDVGLQSHKTSCKVRMQYNQLQFLLKKWLTSAIMQQSENAARQTFAAAAKQLKTVDNCYVGKIPHMWQICNLLLSVCYVRNSCLWLLEPCKKPLLRVNCSVILKEEMKQMVYSCIIEMPVCDLLLPICGCDCHLCKAIWKGDIWILPPSLFNEGMEIDRW